MHSPRLGVYRHYKGNLYELVAIGRHSETEEPMAIYRGLYDSTEFGARPWWTRPLALFGDTVEKDGKAVPRFAYLGANEAAATQASNS